MASSSISSIFRPGSLKEAVTSVFDNKFLPEEKAWIGKIEALRNSLSKSTVRISIIDYGAGSPDSKLTVNQMRRGRMVNRTIGEVCKTASTSYKYAFLLFKLIREFQPNIVLEIGAGIGISAAYQAAALKLNHHGKMVTLEGARPLASLAEENFKNLGLENINVVVGRFSDVLPTVLLKNAPIDFVFIDGHHDKEATVSYFKQVLPYLSDKAILVFDDISWSKGMKQAWNTIKKNKNLGLVLDLHKVGICIIQKAPLSLFRGINKYEPNVGRHRK